MGTSPKADYKEAKPQKNAPTDAVAVANMKARLQDYRALNRDIDNCIERLERLEERMYSVKSPNLNGMPKTPSSVPDKLADLVSRKDELEEKTRMLICRRDNERKEIEDITNRLRSPDERAVICMRYIDNEEWSAIIDMLFGDRENFNEDFDNYKQRVFRLHISAIVKMSQM